MRNLFALASLVIVNTGYAQNRNDSISGIVYDEAGPMMTVTVYERDSMNNIVSLDVTDNKGNFSFSLSDPQDVIWVTYPGYDTVVVPINKQYYEIKLTEIKDSLPTVLFYDCPPGLLSPLNDSNNSPEE